MKGEKKDEEEVPEQELKQVKPSKILHLDEEERVDLLNEGVSEVELVNAKTVGTGDALEGAGKKLVNETLTDKESDKPRVTVKVPLRSQV